MKQIASFLAKLASLEIDRILLVLAGLGVFFWIGYTDSHKTEKAGGAKTERQGSIKLTEAPGVMMDGPESIYMATHPITAYAMVETEKVFKACLLVRGVIFQIYQKRLRSVTVDALPDLTDAEIEADPSFIDPLHPSSLSQAHYPTYDQSKARNIREALPSYQQLKHQIAIARSDGEFRALLNRVFLKGKASDFITNWARVEIKTKCAEPDVDLIVNSLAEAQSGPP